MILFAYNIAASFPATASRNSIELTPRFSGRVESETRSFVMTPLSMVSSVAFSS